MTNNRHGGGLGRGRVDTGINANQILAKKLQEQINENSRLKQSLDELSNKNKINVQQIGVGKIKNKELTEANSQLKQKLKEYNNKFLSLKNNKNNDNYNEKLLNDLQLERETRNKMNNAFVDLNKKYESLSNEKNNMKISFYVVCTCIKYLYMNHKMIFLY